MCMYVCRCVMNTLAAPCAWLCTMCACANSIADLAQDIHMYIEFYVHASWLRSSIAASSTDVHHTPTHMHAYVHVYVLSCKACACLLLGAGEDDGEGNESRCKKQRGSCERDKWRQSLLKKLGVEEKEEEEEGSNQGGDDEKQLGGDDGDDEGEPAKGKRGKKGKSIAISIAAQLRLLDEYEALCSDPTCKHPDKEMVARKRSGYYQGCCANSKWKGEALRDKWRLVASICPKAADKCKEVLQFTRILSTHRDPTQMHVHMYVCMYICTSVCTCAHM